MNLSCCGLLIFIVGNEVFTQMILQDFKTLNLVYHQVRMYDMSCLSLKVDAGRNIHKHNAHIDKR